MKVDRLIIEYDKRRKDDRVENMQLFIIVNNIIEIKINQRLGVSYNSNNIK